MHDKIEGVTLQERQVGRQWLITSTDLPGLHVAHADLSTARRAVPAAIRMLREMAGRRPAAETADVIDLILTDRWVGTGAPPLQRHADED